MKTKITKYSIKKTAALLLITFAGSTAYAQQTTENLLNHLISKNVLSQEEADSIRSEAALEAQKNLKNEVFSIDLEARGRSEIRNGFRQLRSDTTYPAIFTSQRTRLNLNYKKEKFAAALSLQDIRTWGAADPRSNAGTVQVFEAWAEPFFNSNLSLRIGKQRFMLDNQRLFAQNDWRNNAGTHDAVNLIYNTDKFEAQTLFAWNQTTEGNFYTNFAPVGFSNYKSLFVNYLKWKGEHLALTGINYYEGFQYGGTFTKNAFNRTEHQNFRYTNGGRVEYTIGKFYATLSGYVQWGHNQVGKKLSAFYIQPEVKYTATNTEIRFGAEIKSGNNPLAKDKWATEYDHAFQYPYGVAHRFNGTMEFFASSYPGSTKDVGLINPYFFIEQKIGEKFAVSLQNHLFYSQWIAYDSKTKKNAPNNYLGYEGDILLTYRPNKYTKIDLGFSALKADKALEWISSGKSDYLPYWSYLQATFNPKLLSIKK
ncbi:MAG: alginate export family protein [Flavobacteriales bacterium]